MRLFLSLLIGIVLGGGSLELSWNDRGEIASVRCEGVELSPAANQHTVIFSPEKPDLGFCGNYPFPEYYKVCVEHNFQQGYEKNIAECYNSAILNVSGTAFSPSICWTEQLTDGSVLLRYNMPCCAVEELWRVAGEDIEVIQRLLATQAGWFSLASPSLVSIDKDSFKWAGIPGYFHSDHFNRESFDLAYNYGFGLPDSPVICRERTVTTLTGYVTDSNGITIAASAAPGQGRDPWEIGESTNRKCLLGLSLENRYGEFCPTVYHPLLGEAGSRLEAGDTLTLTTIFSAKKSGWYDVFRHVVMDVNRLEDNFAFKQTALSLSERLQRMWEYVLSDTTSLWKNVDFDGITIGAQEYRAPVYHSDSDAMKNADYGAMWMLSSLTSDPRLSEDRLPAARAFKMVQQQPAGSLFSGAPRGQYFLYKSGTFTEEFGNYTEPVANTYYMLLDLGNMYLFEPHDKEILQSIGMAAERLLEWMHPEGYWEVAYENECGTPIFTDLKDFRPTFYGLVVAYRVLGEKKYLRAAETAAKWLKSNAVDHGSYLGVCGDTRFLCDFSTAQCARAFLDLYEITHNREYLEAATEITHHYTNQIFTHPFPSEKMKLAGHTIREWRHDYEISQVGLNFEHAATFGSCANAGPILLASHAGMFVREAARTGDTMLLDLARLAACGRDAFVNMETGVASYYWRTMNRGSGPYPHHAWWQIGWIMDYLVSEAYLRSGGKIDFPSGFFAPKVGPHVPYGFKPGRIYGRKVNLCMRHGLVKSDNPNIEYLCAKSCNGKEVYAILMNSSDRQQHFMVSSDYTQEVFSGTLEPFGLKVVKILGAPFTLPAPEVQ